MANGITGCALAQTWPSSNPSFPGLLPDFITQNPLQRGGPGINPGSVQTGLPEYFGEGSLYDVARVTGRNWLLHAPARLEIRWESNDGIGFATRGWGGLRYHVLLSAVSGPPPGVVVGPYGSPEAELGPASTTYDGANGWLVISGIIGDAEFVIRAGEH